MRKIAYIQQPPQSRDLIITIRVRPSQSRESSGILSWFDRKPCIFLHRHGAILIFVRLQSFEQVAKKERAHGDSVWCAAWKNKYIISGSINGHVKAWTESLEEVADFPASALSVIGVASNGKRT